VANKRHLKRLVEGTATWNAWRQLHLNERVDLIAVDLSNADLRGANLSGAEIFSADLSGANLFEAKLNGASLSETNLSGADLSRADLTDANLSNANLLGATLNSTKLNRANLNGADLSKASLSETIFASVDLTNVVGLETCQHRGPSSFDSNSLQKFDQLPLVFLRGVGLPDKFIEYLPSLVGQAIQYYSCFISYSAKDDEFAKRIHADLQSSGVRRWFAPHDLPIGGRILDEIDAAIRVRDKLLVILSENSIRSDWVEDEVKTAYEEERRRGQTMLLFVWMIPLWTLRKPGRPNCGPIAISATSVTGNPTITINKASSVFCVT
jgi:uncharacterized protein YjbI with pentapeptide repeats